MSSTSFFDFVDSDFSEVIRKKKEDCVRPCSRCLEPTPNMRACAGCKAIKYCSRECQKEDWPQHKLLCTKATEVDLANVCRFLQRFFKKMTRSLDYHFQSAILHKIRSLGLEISRETTFKATFFVGFEPVDLHDFGNILYSPTFLDGGRLPQGMLQILDLTVSSEPSAEAMSRADRARLREFLDESGLSSIPIVLIHFGYFKPDDHGEIQNYAYSTAIPFFFTDTSDADRAQAITVPSISSNNIEGVKKLKSFDSCLEYINMTIRQDHQNQYNARMKMTRQDMKALHMALRGKGDMSLMGLSLTYLRKFRREDIYDLIPETKRIKTISDVILRELALDDCGTYPSPGQSI